MTVSDSQPKKHLILNILANGSPVTWREPNDTSREFSRSIDPWVELAQKGEKGKIHAIFVADHLTLYDAYDGPFNFRHPLRFAAGAPKVGPTEAVGAMALHTKSIGLALTISTVSEHPYIFAKRIATLDHISNGRIGWNVVTSFMENSGRQLLNGEPIPEHDERYTRAQEYLEVIYRLLLSSWRDDAVVYDKEKGVFADPDRVREINYKGKYYDVPGPAVTEPTPQRVPVILQAGASSKGKEFAAENAEAVFLDGNNPGNFKKAIADIKHLAKTKHGRDPNSIKFLPYTTPIIGKTHEEAVAKAERIGIYSNPEAISIFIGGLTGYDLAKYELDDPVDFIKPNGIQTVTQNALNKFQGPKPTKREILDNFTKGAGTFIGTPEEIADELEQWVEDYDVDGFVFSISLFPSGVDDVVELLVPELQKRGIFQKEYATTGGTFRENLFEEKGRTFLREDHPANKLRWTSDLTAEEFEKKLNN